MEREDKGLNRLGRRFRCRRPKAGSVTGSRCLELGAMNLPVHARQGSNLAETEDPTMCRAQGLARSESLIGQRVQFGGFVRRLGNPAGLVQATICIIRGSGRCPRKMMRLRERAGPVGAGDDCRFRGEGRVRKRSRGGREENEARDQRGRKNWRSRGIGGPHKHMLLPELALVGARGGDDGGA